MSKTIYSEEVIWYNEGVHRAITALADKYDNAIPVFGGALGAYNCINSNEPRLQVIRKLLAISYPRC